MASKTYHIFRTAPDAEFEMDNDPYYVLCGAFGDLLFGKGKTDLYITISTSSFEGAKRHGFMFDGVLWHITPEGKKVGTYLRLLTILDELLLESGKEMGGLFDIYVKDVTEEKE